VPGRDDASPQLRLRVFQLSHVEPDKTLEDALKLVFPRGGPGHFSLDRQRKRVIINAPEVTAKTVEALLVRLDEPPRAQLAPNVRVRVVWLISGHPADKEAPLAAPPADLKEVLPGLAKLGIDKPRLAAQAVLSVRPNARFETKGAARLGLPCQFAVSGRFSDREVPGLDLRIKATRPGGLGTEEICNLQTEISAPPGHLVVLGVTPTDGATSVFVVQVLPQEEKKPAPRKPKP